MMISIDCETGGVGVDRSLLTACFLLLDDRFQVLDSLNLKLIPNDGVYHVDPKGMEINRIDLVALAKDPETLTYKQAGTKLYDTLTRWRAGAPELIPLGKNVYFDLTFIWEHLLSRKAWNSLVSYRQLDLSSIAQFLKLLGYLPATVSGSLGSLREYYQLPLEVAHTADGDARTNINVLGALAADVLKRAVEQRTTTASPVSGA